MTHTMTKGGTCWRDEGHTGQCDSIEAHERLAAKRAQQRREDPAVREYHQAYYWNNRERARQRQRKWELKQYGLTPEEYELLVVEQDGRCAICKVETQELHVDHDHTKPGTYRALLCRLCNWMLGNAHDDPNTLMAAIEYLRSHA